MKYFELYNIPISFFPNKETVKQQFYTLSKQYHPDFFVNESEEKKTAALAMASLVNVAFKTLSDEDATLQYILQEKKIIAANEKMVLPPDFLMAMMELNERLEVAITKALPNEIAQIKQEVCSLKKELYASVVTIMETYKEGAEFEKELLPLKQFYYQKKYIEKLLASRV